MRSGCNIVGEHEPVEERTKRDALKIQVGDI